MYLRATALAIGILVVSPPIDARQAVGPRPGLERDLRRGGQRLRPFGRAHRRHSRPDGHLSLQRIEGRARAHLRQAEAGVRLAYAPGIGERQRLSRLARALRSYGRWEGEVNRLIRARRFESPVYQEWVRKTWEASLVQLHAAVKLERPHAMLSEAVKGGVGAAEARGMLRRLKRLPGAEYRHLIGSVWNGLYGEARGQGAGDLLAHNPLALLPRSWGATRSQRVAARTVSYRPPREALAPETWLERPTYKVRRDVAFVWVPAVIRTYQEFASQRRTLLQNGVLALRAETGVFRSSFRNAYDVAEAVNKARRITGNPDVKVVLVGHSQGVSAIYAFLQAGGRDARERALLSELRKNVVHVHGMSSAARGSPLADLIQDVSRIVTGQQEQVKGGRARLSQLSRALHRASHPVYRYLARQVDAAKDRGPRKGLRKRLGAAINRLLVRRAGVVSTAAGQELMASERLAGNLRGISVHHSVGAVPAARGELMPEGIIQQQAAWSYMRELGMANDYQVPTRLQRVGGVVRGAVDLPTQAIGHWGMPANNVGRRMHREKHYRSYSAELHTFTMLEVLGRMGVL
jgi:hypothetical protein